MLEENHPQMTKIGLGDEQDQKVTGCILFITRNYPPKVGGLEEYSYNLIKEFEAHESTHKITLSKPTKHLIWFFPYSFLKALYLISKYSIRSVHLCDGFLAPLGLMLKWLTGAKVTVSIVGLDITFNNHLYQSIVPWCVKRLDRVISISRSTRDECVRRGISPFNCTVIPVGIVPTEHSLFTPKADLRLKLERTTGFSLKEKTVLVTIGRLVKRKGVAWFVEHVMPHLDVSYCYLVAGNGPDYTSIKTLVERYGLGDRVCLLGRISDEEKKVVYNASDIFIMPNITIRGDVEGFGIVALEAGSCGLPVVASNIQGLKDAVIDGKTGYLVEERDVDGFVGRITGMDLDKEQIREIVNSTFDWTKIYKGYRTFLFS
jgi:glycosyltransferase involved in cell wall biosynthesis